MNRCVARFAALLLGIAATVPALTVKVWPDKLRVKPGEPVRLAVTVSGLPVGQAAAVTCRLATGVDVEVARFSGNTDADGVASFTFAPQAEWGYGVTVEARNGAESATACEVFACARNPLTVAPAYNGGCVIGWALTPGDTEHLLRQAQKQVDRSRYLYTPVYEIMPLYYDPFMQIRPPSGVEHYVCDQGSPGYRFTAAVQQEWIRRFRATGVQPIIYANSQVSGHGGTEFVRRHPEFLVFAPDGTPMGGMGMNSVAPIQKYYREYPASLQDKELMAALGKLNQPAGFDIVRLNFTDLDLVTHGATALLEGQKFFGYAGVRYDGHYGVPALGDPLAPISDCRDIRGQPQPGGKEGDRLTGRNMRHAIDTVRAKDPDFIFGFNYAGFRDDQMGDAVLASAEAQAIAPGNMILDEVAKGSLSPAAPEHRWADFLDHMSHQVDRLRRLNGHLVAGWGGGPGEGEVDTKQVMAASLACGLRWNPGGWKKLPGGDGCVNDAARRQYAQFAMRYSEFILNNALQRLPPGEAARQVQVSSQRPLFWDRSVQRLATPGGHFLVLHFINQPVEEGLTVTAVAPPPAANVRVTVTAAGKSGRVTVLSPDAPAQPPPVTATVRDGKLEFVIPRIELWTLAIIEE